MSACPCRRVAFLPEGLGTAPKGGNPAHHRRLGVAHWGPGPLGVDHRHPCRECPPHDHRPHPLPNTAHQSSGHGIDRGVPLCVAGKGVGHPPTAHSRCGGYRRPYDCVGAERRAPTPPPSTPCLSTTGYPLRLTITRLPLTIRFVILSYGVAHFLNDGGNWGRLAWPYGKRVLQPRFNLHPGYCTSGPIALYPWAPGHARKEGK